jgi:hypothetical protein
LVVMLGMRNLPVGIGMMKGLCDALFTAAVNDL